SAMGMQEGGAGAGARHEAAARAARPTSFCLAAEPLYGPPGRGDFLVADGMWSRSIAMRASQAPRGETDGLASIPCSRTPADGNSILSWRGRLTAPGAPRAACSPPPHHPQAPAGACSLIT